MTVWAATVAVGGVAGGVAVAREAATGAAAVRAAVGAAAAGAATLEPPAGGGEERRTRGRKALPPWVFTILKPEKEKKGEGAAETGNGM